MPRQDRERGRATNYDGVTHLGGTRYRIRGTWMDPRTGRRRQVEREIEAQSPRAASAELERQVGAATGHVSAGQTERRRVSDCVRSWLALKAPDVDKGTADKYADALEHLADVYRDPDDRAHVLADFYSDAVRAEDVKAWVNGQLAAGYALATVKTWIATLRMVVRDQEWPSDPTARLSWPDVAPSRSKHALKPDELLAVLRRLRMDYREHYAVIAVAAFTGQRWCHVSALKFEDVDRDANELRFPRAHVKGRIKVPSAKKPATKAWPLDDGVIAAIIEDQRAYLIGRTPNPDGWMFPSRVGKPRAPSSVTKAWTAALQAEEVERHVQIQGLRRTATDLLRRAGVDPRVRQELIGHVSEAVHASYQTVGRDEKAAGAGAMLRLVQEG